MIALGPVAKVSRNLRVASKLLHGSNTERDTINILHWYKGIISACHSRGGGVDLSEATSF